MSLLRYCVVLLAVVLSLVTTATGQTVTLTMGEVPSRAANGLTVKGVTFTAAGTVLFNTTGPGIQRFVQAPCLVGNSGTSLTMDFPGEVSNLSLGVAISAGGSLTPGFRVELFNGGTSLGIFPVNTATFFTFT